MSNNINADVCLIIPAFNEEKSIESVLRTAVDSCVFSKIVCVDDGSIDKTFVRASTVESVIVVSQVNAGKALAMKRGLRESGNSKIICFLDADLINFTVEHVRSLVEPVINGSTQATIGIFSGGRGATDFAQRVAPLISGQRCLISSILDDFDIWNVRFGIEHALNDHLKEKGIQMLRVELPGASHIMKEEKRGYISGFSQRLRMYYEIIKYNLTKRVKKNRLNVNK